MALSQVLHLCLDHALGGEGGWEGGGKSGGVYRNSSTQPTSSVVDISGWLGSVESECPQCCDSCPFSVLAREMIAGRISLIL